MRHPSYKDQMTYREFLEARRDHMDAERQAYDPNSASWHFFHGRMLSYSNMLNALDGTELITQTPGKKLSVEAAE